MPSNQKYCSHFLMANGFLANLVVRRDWIKQIWAPNFLTVFFHSRQTSQNLI